MVLISGKPDFVACKNEGGDQPRYLHSLISAFFFFFAL